MKRTEPLLLGAAAIFVVVSQIILAVLAPGFTHASATTVSAVLPLIFLIALPTAMALLAVPALVRLRNQGAALGLMIAAGAALRLIWLAAPAIIENDFYRYLWDGAVLAHGYNPWTYSPEQILDGAGVPPTLEALGQEGKEILQGVNFPNLRSIYPGTAEAVFAAAHLAAPWSLTGLRIAFLAAETTTLLLLMALLRRMGLSPLWAAFYWCNPFVAVMAINAAHVDAVLPPLILGAVLAAGRGGAVFASILLGLAAGVKLWPMLLAPLALSPLTGDLRRLALAGAAFFGVLALVTAPLLHSALAEKSGLVAYAGAWATNNGFFAWAAWAMRPVFPEGAAEPLLRMALATSAGIVALGAAIRPAPTVEDLLQRALIVAATVFYLSPAQFPWYALWFLPLAAAERNGPLLAASALLPAYYLSFPLWETGRSDLVFYGVAFIHSVPVLGWLVWRWLQPPARADGRPILGGNQ